MTSHVAIAYYSLEGVKLKAMLRGLGQNRHCKETLAWFDV